MTIAVTLSALTLGAAGIALAEEKANHGVTAPTAAAPAAHGGAHWSYEGPEGPANWGDLEESFAACRSGRMQSPVDLGGADAEGSIVISTRYNAVPLSILNNGHTVQFNTDAGGELSANGVTYKLLQVHFHTPAEHPVFGKVMPLEAHFVHKSDEGSLAVVGVFFVEGTENSTLASVLAHLPEEPAEAKTYAGVTIDPNGLLPSNMALFRYMGSLTTPPCTEGVNWHVLRTTATASKQQIARLSAVLNANARPVQPLNRRLLVAPPQGGSS